MESLSRILLFSIHGYETTHGSGPTARELATDLGLPEEFGHRHLVERLNGQVALGHIAHYGGRFRLTEAGHEALAGETAPEAPLPHAVTAAEKKPSAATVATMR